MTADQRERLREIRERPTGPDVPWLLDLIDEQEKAVVALMNGRLVDVERLLKARSACLS